MFDDVLFLIQSPILGTRTFYNAMTGVDFNVANLLGLNRSSAAQRPVIVGAAARPLGSIFSNIYNYIGISHNRIMNSLCDYFFGVLNLRENIYEFLARYDNNILFLTRLRINYFQQIVSAGIQPPVLHAPTIDGAPLTPADSLVLEAPMFNLETINGVPQIILTNLPSRIFRSLINPEDIITMLNPLRFDLYNYPNLLNHYLNQQEQNLAVTTTEDNPATPIMNMIQRAILRNNNLTFDETVIDRSADQYGMFIFNEFVRDMRNRGVNLIENPEELLEFFEVVSTSANML
ncbi:MAG: hypothetical protein JSY10_29725 [Paenibacillus sp.]|nr:hypothetical protein [Paenibacillus sp.]